MSTVQILSLVGIALIVVAFVMRSYFDAVDDRRRRAEYRERMDALSKRLAAAPPLNDELRRIDGFNVTYAELDRACMFLRSRGWSGFIPFDQAVRALSIDDGSSE
jgi:hypothetical protein